MAGLLHAPATDSGGSDIRSSFRRAIAEATAAGAAETVPKGRRAADVDDDDEASDDDDDDESPATDADDEDEDLEAGAGDDAEAEGDEPDDEAEAGAEGDETEDEGEDAEDEEPDARAAELLSDKEIKAIQRAHPNDPAAQIKAYQRAFTRKTQELAKEAKTYKGLNSYLPLVQAYENDPVDTIKKLARMNGLTLEDLEDAAPARGKGKGKAAAADDSDDTTAFIDKVVTKFKASLGPEVEYLGESLAPAMTEAMQAIADHVAGKRVKGLEDATVTLTRGNAELESDRVMDSFYAAHADAKDEDFANEMDELAVTLIGGRNGEPIRPVPMSEAQFLEFLYDTVKNKRLAAGGAKETVDKEARRLMKKRLAKLNTARSGERRATAPITDDKIQRRPKGAVSIRDAFKAAKAGVRFDDNEDDDD